MAEFSFPWPDTSVPGPTVGDGRKITAEEYATYMLNCFGDGVLPTNNQLEVTTSGANTVDVDTGQAVVRGRFYDNNVAAALTPASAPPGTTRKDSVVLECDWGGTGATEQYTVRLLALAGTAIAYPALTQTINVLWQMEIYRYTIDDAGAITGITDVRTWAEPRGSHMIGELREVWAATLGGSDGRRLVDGGGRIYEAWVNCDGGAAVNGVIIPDLRDRVLAGVSGAHGAGTTGGADTANLAHTHTEGTLAAASHTHGAGSFAAASHSHAVGTIAAGSHTHAKGTLANGGGSAHTHSLFVDMSGVAMVGVGAYTIYNGSESAHTHTLSGSTAATTPSMSGSTDTAAPAVSGTSGATAPAVSGTTASGGSASQDMRQATAYVYRFIYVGW